MKNVHLSLISIQIDVFQEYARYIENSFQKELKKYEDGAKDLEEEVADSYWEHYMDDVHQFSDDFPKIMRNSLFVSIHAFLEDKIIELCVPKDESSKKFSFGGIKKAVNYLKKDLGMNVPYDTKEWKNITNAISIRNCLVHCNGVVSKAKNEEQLENAIEDMSFVSKDDYGRISLDSGFCLDFLENVHSFLRQLYELEE